MYSSTSASTFNFCFKLFSSILLPISFEQLGHSTLYIILKFGSHPGQWSRLLSQIIINAAALVALSHYSTLYLRCSVWYCKHYGKVIISFSSPFLALFELFLSSLFLFKFSSISQLQLLLTLSASRIQILLFSVISIIVVPLRNT